MWWYTTACNTGAEGECEYPEDNYDCDGNCTAVVDECGECGGDGSTEGACDCEANVYDCTYDPDDESTWEAACGGTIVLDECGECGGDGIIEVLVIVIVMF